MLETALGRKARIDRRPPAQGDLPVTFADLSKANRLLNYRPKVPFEDGLNDYVDWFCRWHQISRT
jgi:UDP-glucuronate 4-epimerase